MICDTVYRCEELACFQARRQFIEHSFREAKSESGLADYRVRRWHCALIATFQGDYGCDNEGAMPSR